MIAYFSKNELCHSLASLRFAQDDRSRLLKFIGQEAN
jgi:hypothetical protein